MAKEEIKNFLHELAALIKKYEATFEYTNDDDGIHVCIGETEVFVGFLDQDAAQKLLTKGKLYEQRRKQE